MTWERVNRKGELKLDAKDIVINVNQCQKPWLATQETSPTQKWPLNL